MPPMPSRCAGAKLDRSIVYAPNVRTGGGLVLLRSLLASRWPGPRPLAFLDERARADLESGAECFDIQWVAPGPLGRLRAEWNLSKRSRASDRILYFHNLPPLFPTRGLALCYMQNAYVIDAIAAELLGGRAKFRITLERLIARHFKYRCDRYIVQTPTMRDALAKWYGKGVPPIDILPIAPPMARTIVFHPESKEHRSLPSPDFIYVSDGQPHKNHRRLFAAWRLLAQSGIRPSLALTLHPDRDVDLRLQVEQMAGEGIAVMDIGVVPHEMLAPLYRNAGALIFPSLGESFGNPLVEAATAGLPILAPELDYVRDVCEPAETFDPRSSRSIARAVRRFMRLEQRGIAALHGDEFVAALARLNEHSK